MKSRSGTDSKNNGAPFKKTDSEHVCVATDAEIDSILALLQMTSGVDFRVYKTPTIRRRIERRMSLRKIRKFEKYLDYLKQHPLETQELYRDLLIRVTSFFRDPEIFKVLRDKVLPQILRHHAANEPVRVWVPGCCTGEEVYSIAMVLLEYLNARNLHPPIQIFGTDVSDDALEKARSGIYSSGIIRDVSMDRLERFFLKVKGGYQITKAVRDLCVFAKQNLAADPPFSKLDLISCRNVLIYFSLPLQQKILPVFHYALKPQGHLVLGKSETIASFSGELFQSFDKRNNIYAKKASVVRPDLNFRASTAASDGNGANGASSPKKTPPADADLAKRLDRVLLNGYAPAAVLLNDSFEILQTRGDVSPYLKITSGKITLNVLRMAREGLDVELQLALQKARSRKARAAKQGIRLKDGRRYRSVSLEVVPMSSPLGKERHYLVVFTESGAAQTLPRAEKMNSADRRIIGRLKHELASTKEYLQLQMEQQEQANQDLKSANEEILSSNEELQSMNEELETAKEELESTNEELKTVNEELGQRNAELKASFERLEESRNALDEAQSVARIGSWSWDVKTDAVEWSAELYRIYGMRPGEAAITFERFLERVPPEDTDLVRDCIRRAMKDGRPFQFEHRVRRPDGAYRRLEARGRVLKDAAGRPVRMIGTGQDVTEKREAEEQLKLSEERFRLLVESVQDYAIFMLDPDGQVATWNLGAQRLKGYASSEIVGRHFSAFYPAQDKDRTEEVLRTAARKGVYREEGWRVKKDGTRFWASVTITALRDTQKKLVGFAKVTRDMSERKRHEEELERANQDLERRVRERTADLEKATKELHASLENAKESEERFRAMADSAPVMIWTSQPDGSRDYFNRLWLQFTGRSIRQCAGDGWMDSIHPQDLEELLLAYEEAHRSHSFMKHEYRLRRADGAYRWVIVHAAPRMQAGQFAGFVGSTVDIGDRKREEENLRLLSEANEILSRTLNTQKMVALLTRSIVPNFADWCAVYLTREDGSLEPAVISHADPAKVEIAKELTRRYPPSPEDPHGVLQVIRSGEPEFVPQVTPDLLERVARDAHHLSVLRSLGLVSGITVPLVARDRTFGAISFVTSESGRIYDDTDLSVAREIARRTALALDNVRLYERSRENEAAFRTVSEAIPQIVWTARPDGYADYYNARWYDYTGLTPELSRGDGFTEALHPDDRARTAAAWKKAVESGETYEIEYRFRRASDGEYRWHLGRAYPQLDEHGRIVRWFGTCTDIHDKRVAEESLRERTHQLVESNKELEQFAYVASHDLQEPLRKIIAFSDRLKAREIAGMGPVEKDYFDRMQSAALRMKTLIEDLLNFSRVTSKEAPLAEVDLGQAVREAANDLEQRIAQTGAVIEAGPLPVIESNALHMKQLFQNLIGNSIKFARQGETPRIRVESRSEDGFHEIAVIDNGIGFDEKYLDRIFKPFQRLHGREEYPGTGIGLAICQKIVQRHGGTLTARSRPGEGAAFLVRLPVKSEENLKKI